MQYQRIFTSGERFRYGYFQWMDHWLGRDRVFKLHNKSRRRLYRDFHERMKQEGVKGGLVEIDRRSDLTPEMFQKEYIDKGLPVVLEGKAAKWACVQNWSLDYFKERYGEEEILYVNHDSLGEEYEKMSLAEILDGIREDKSKYFRFYPLLQRHPEHLKDFDYEWLLKFRHRWNWNENFQVFIGGEGSETQLHNASSCNLFTQVYGEKKWVLYPPYYTMVLDPDPSHNVYRVTSARQGTLFKPFEPKYDEHPLFRYIDGVKVHLKPGDVLYNPPFWWHAVQNVTDSIGVGYRWLPPAHAFKQARLYFLLDLMAFNPPIWKTLKLVKKDVNLIWLAQSGQLDQFLADESAKENSHYQQSE